ncbi:MAG: hypothetical protein OK439_06600 [Thaumarchaeota archaeon]|nr:hypothetical protein [Nitrososphaerota archaeon]
MSCVDERTLDLRRASEIMKIIDGHHWVLAHFDDFGESGVIARYSCSRCYKEWTNFLLDPESVKSLKY